MIPPVGYVNLIVSATTAYEMISSDYELGKTYSGVCTSFQLGEVEHDT